MDPTQPTNPLGMPTDTPVPAPTPETTPTPGLVPEAMQSGALPTPETMPVSAPEPTTPGLTLEMAPEVAPAPELTPTPMSTEPMTEPVLETPPASSIDVAQPAEAFPSSEAVVSMDSIGGGGVTSTPDAAMPTAITSEQAVVGGPVVSSDSNTAIPESSPKSKKGLLIGLIAGGVVLIAAIVAVLFLFVFNGGTIGSLDEFKSAIDNKKAVNCIVTLAASDTTGNSSSSSALAGDMKITLQANDGWSKIKMKMNIMVEINTLVTDGTMYSWADGATTGQKAQYNSSQIDSSISQIKSSAKSVECEPNNKADFSVPSNINFTDANS